MWLRAMIAVAAALAAPAAATAATVAVDGDVLVYTAGPGETNGLSLFQPRPEEFGAGGDERDHEHFWIDDPGALPAAQVTTGEGCRQLEDQDASRYNYSNQQCDATGVASVWVDLGDGADIGGVRTDLPVALFGGSGDDFPLYPPMHGTVDGGPGNDGFSVLRGGDASIRGGPGYDTAYFDTYPESAVRVSLDGRPNDGDAPSPANDVRADVEGVVGGDFADTIIGSEFSNTLDGGLGSDTLSGEAGDDTIDAVDVYHDFDNHHPPLDYRPTRDEVACGAGADVVKADVLDAVSDDCERVSVFKTRLVRVDEYHWTHERQLRLALFTLRGSDGPDRLIGVDSAPNRILAGAGDDRVRGGSRRDEIDAGPGTDVVRPGRRADRVSAGAGNDVISARDGDADTIACGGGRDRVVADREDRVSRGCEVVHRR
jgi:Ca2+-binding RTX toxin-like protein